MAGRPKGVRTEGSNHSPAAGKVQGLTSALVSSRDLVNMQDQSSAREQEERMVPVGWKQMADVLTRLLKLSF